MGSRFEATLGGFACPIDPPSSLRATDVDGLAAFARRVTIVTQRHRLRLILVESSDGSVRDCFLARPTDLHTALAAAVEKTAGYVRRVSIVAVGPRQLRRRSLLALRRSVLIALAVDRRTCAAEILSVDDFGGIRVAVGLPAPPHRR